MSTVLNSPERVKKMTRFIETVIDRARTIALANTDKVGYVLIETPIEKSDPFTDLLQGAETTEDYGLETMEFVEDEFKEDEDDHFNSFYESDYELLSTHQSDEPLWGYYQFLWGDDFSQNLFKEDLNEGGQISIENLFSDCFIFGPR